jgi:hypothetical protein
VDADVDVDGERVVAPGDVLEPLADAAVVLRVDQVLRLVVRQRMGSRRTERDAEGAGLGHEPPAAVGLTLERVVDVEPAA